LPVLSPLGGIPLKRGQSRLREKPVGCLPPREFKSLPLRFSQVFELPNCPRNLKIHYAPPTPSHQYPPLCGGLRCESYPNMKILFLNEAD